MADGDDQCVVDSSTPEEQYPDVNTDRLARAYELSRSWNTVLL